MSEHWKIGFRRALIDAIVKNGSPLSPTPSAYGYLHSEWQAVRKLVSDVGVDYDRTGEPREVDWDEFRGTFYEGDTRRVGLDLDVVLRDGSTHAFRYDGTVSDLISQVLAETG